jgi:hypothetical protein
MRFKTYLKAGGKYGIHAHDCNEYATVIKGHLIEMLNNKKVYNEGETVTYLANFLHEPLRLIVNDVMNKTSFIRANTPRMLQQKAVLVKVRLKL